MKPTLRATRRALLQPLLAAAIVLPFGLPVAQAQSTSAPTAANPIVIKFGHVVAPNTPKGRGSEKFKELAERYTEGRVKVEVYPNSTLYKDNEEMNALQLGAVQMLAPSLAKFGPLGVRDFEVFDLPYIFHSKDDLRKITDGPIGRELFEKLGPTGVKGLAYWDNGFKIMTANTPLHTPDDMLGLKMRIQSSKVLEALMTALDAVPQVMAFSESYQALQTGVVDGTENTPSNIYSQKMHEVQKHGTLTWHSYIGYALITNAKFWDELPADIRAQLDRAVKEATEFTNTISQEENDAALAAMRAAGTTTFYEPTPAERKEWIDRMQPVYKEMAPRVGQATLDAVFRALGR